MNISTDIIKEDGKMTNNNTRAMQLWEAFLLLNNPHTAYSKKELEVAKWLVNRKRGQGMKKIVIEIPDEIYKGTMQIKESRGISSEDVIQIPLECISNGTVLPDNHGRLIDADALNETYIYECISECDRCEHCSKDGHGCELLLNAPTILEAKEQSTGDEWVDETVHSMKDENIGLHISFTELDKEESE